MISFDQIPALGTTVQNQSHSGMTYAVALIAISTAIGIVLALAGLAIAAGIVISRILD